MKYGAANRAKRFLQCQAAALLHGGICLSAAFTDTKTKLRWRCAKGHEWEALPWNVLKGHWCLICGNERQGRAKAHSILEAQKLATDRGGFCLSSDYLNNNTKLRWQCAKGHEWEAVPTSISRGSWCPICAGKLPPTQALAELRQAALQKGGALLSDRYAGAKGKLRWKCADGHEWEATSTGIKQGSWCPVCGGSQPLTLADCQAAAKTLGGECLSAKYINSHTPLLWRCADGHEWEASPTHVRDGHWCPNCSVGISERICRALFEYTTGVLFPKRRPTWLKNESGNWMELDGYAESLGLAFEYHGQQHYEQSTFFHRDEAAFRQRIRDDTMKRTLCKENGVTLIEVPYTIKHHDLQSFLLKELRALPNSAIIRTTKDVNLGDLGVRNFRRLDEVRAIAASRGGLCLSDFYLNSTHKLRWSCSRGHEWDAVPGSVKSGSWCSICGDVEAARKRAYTIQDMRALAKAKGGVCLSPDYHNAKSRLLWRCCQGHEWETQASVIISGHWCPKCEKERLGRKYSLTIEDMRKAAANHGGECLSTSYRSNRSRLSWKCAEGHEWEAIAGSVRRGSWCPVCSGRPPFFGGLKVNHHD